MRSLKSRKFQYHLLANMVLAFQGWQSARFGGWRKCFYSPGNVGPTRVPHYTFAYWCVKKRKHLIHPPVWVDKVC